MINLYEFIGKHDEKELERLSVAYELLSKPINVMKMIVMSDLGLPAISGVVYELECSVNCSKMETRQNIGRLIKHILKQYGYIITPKREQLRTFTGADHFTTGSVYEKDLTVKPEYKLIISSERNI